MNTRHMGGDEEIKKLTALREELAAEQKQNPISVSVSGKTLSEDDIQKFLNDDSIHRILKMKVHDRKMQGVGQTNHSLLTQEHSYAKELLREARKLRNEGNDFAENTEKLGRSIARLSEHTKAITHDIEQAQNTGHTAPAVGAKEDSKVAPPNQPDAVRTQTPPRREIQKDDINVYVSPDVNSFAELQKLKFSSVGLDQILTSPQGSRELKERIDGTMNRVLDGLTLPKTKKAALQLEKKIPEFAKAHQARQWLNATLLMKRGSSGKIDVGDIEEYRKLLADLAHAVRKLSPEERAALVEKKDKAEPIPQQATDAKKEAVKGGGSVDQKPVAPETPQKKDEILSMSGTATGTMGQMNIKVEEKPEEKSSSYHEIHIRLRDCKVRLDDASRNNPAALVSVLGGAYSKEFVPLYTETVNEFTRIVEQAEAGADVDENAIKAATDKLERLETLSERIVQALGGGQPVNPDGTPTPNKPEKGAEQSKPNPSSPPADVLKEAVTKGMAKGTPETVAALGVLKDKYNAYRVAREAYEKALDAHYGAYRSNTGTALERTRRGIGKFFGIGPKHTPELEALHVAMNTARVDFSQSRLAAMDARVKSKIASGPHAAALTTWNENLNKREFGRSIVRSSEELIQRQYGALAPEQQRAMGAIRSWWNRIPEDKRAMMATIGASTLGVTLSALKTKSAIATGGLSLIAALAGAKAGMLAGALTDSAWNKRIRRANDSLEDISDEAAESANYANVVAFDKALQNQASRIMAMEEARKKHVKAVRVATAATAGMAAGGFLSSDIISGASDSSPDTVKGDLPSKSTDRIVPEVNKIPEGRPGLPIPENEPDGDVGDEDHGKIVIPPTIDLGAESSTMYKMVAGDNPWDLVEEKHFTDKFEGFSKTERDHVIDSAMDRLAADETLRKSIFPGYEGSTFRDMPIGQPVNLTEYEKLIDEELVRHGHSTEEPEETDVQPPPEVEISPEVETREANAQQNINSVQAFASVAEGKGDLENSGTSEITKRLLVTDPGYSEQDARNGGGFQNEEPSTNIIDARTPEGLARQEADLVALNQNEEIDDGDSFVRDPEEIAEIAREREAFIKQLDTVPRSWFSTPDPGAYEGLLKDMKMSDVQEKILNPRPEIVVAQYNTVDDASLRNWIATLKDPITKDLPPDPNETMSHYIRRVAEHYYDREHE